MRHSDSLRDNRVNAGKVIKMGNFEAILDVDGSYLQSKDEEIFLCTCDETKTTSRLKSRRVRVQCPAVEREE